MPCREYLSQVRRASEEIDAMGAGVIALGTGARFQARALEDKGFPYPCLVDADAKTYRALGIGRIGPLQWLRPSMWLRYLRGAKGARQGLLTGDITQKPGVAILDRSAEVQYVYRGERGLGDYPPFEAVLALLRDVVGRE